MGVELKLILERYNNLTQRVITGVAGSALMVGAVIYSEWGYFVIFFSLCLLALREFYTLIEHGGKRPQKKLGLGCGAIIFLLAFFIERGNLHAYYYFLTFPLLSLIYITKLYKSPDKESFTNIAYTVLGVIYIAVPVSLLNAIAYQEGAYRFQIIVGCLFVVWANDSGAYFAGTLFGRRKLFARISPKKSWEGAFGGALLATVFAIGMAQLFDILLLWQWLVVTLIIVVGGVHGDLVESLLKRGLRIKDSGKGIPGHGGFLDRFDSLLLAIPFIVAFLEMR